MTELVSRALYDPLVAERDALAARVTTAEAMVAAQADNRRMDAGRIEMLKAERDSLETRLAAAHGLRARAERAEAALRGLLMICGETHSESVYDALEEIKRARKCLPGEDTSWHAGSKLASVPS